MGRRSPSRSSSGTSKANTTCDGIKSAVTVDIESYFVTVLKLFIIGKKNVVNYQRINRIIKENTDSNIDDDISE